MADPGFQTYVHQFQLPPNALRWWPKALGVCAVFGGIYGAAVGSAIGSVPGARRDHRDCRWRLGCDLRSSWGTDWLPYRRSRSKSLWQVVSGDVCRNRRGNRGRISGDDDPLGLWSDPGCRRRLRPGAGHSSAICLEEDFGRNRGGRAGNVHRSDPMGNKAQSSSGPCRAWRGAWELE